MDIAGIVVTLAIAAFLLGITLGVRMAERATKTVAPSYPDTAIALVSYDRAEGRIWIEILVDLDDVSAPELIRMGNIMYEWTQVLWRAKVNA